MGKPGKENEGGSHQVIIPPNPGPSIPNFDLLTQIATSRLGAAQPWAGSSYRPIDYFAGLQVPQMQMPQFQPGSFGAWGPNPGGTAPVMGMPMGMLGGQQMGLPPGLVYSSLVSGNGAMMDFTSSPWGGAV